MAFGTDWKFYRDREEWKDIKPVEQNDGPHPVVKIAYSEKFKDIFDYFRAILANREISERAFSLSEDAANVNPSNYTVWHFRRVLLQGLKKDLNKELNYIYQVIEDNPKNYQVWHHRQILIEWLQDPSKEKIFTERILKDDPKNYHAWQHRQWVIKKFSLWDDELEFVSFLIELDIRNNSAWNQRYFVISNSTDMSEDIVAGEIKYTLHNIKKAPNNESPWNYLRGILQSSGFKKFSEVGEFTKQLYDSGCRSPHLLGFIIDSIEETLLIESNHDLVLKAVELCVSLMKKHDPIRKQYWKFIGKNLVNLYGLEEKTELDTDSDDSTAAESEIEKEDN